MSFSFQDFNKFVGNLNYYLSLPVEFVEMRTAENTKHDYPVGRLDDILLRFVHYDNFENAVLAWERRKKRLNNNILIVSATTIKEEAITFTKLPFKNKIIFVPKEFNMKDKCCFPVNYLEEDNVLTLGEYIIGTAYGKLSMIDLLSLLLNQKDYARID